MDQVGGSITGLRLSTFRENVRLSVQQKCHLSNPGSYQKSMPEGLPATAASADFRHRCIALRCLCGDPTLLPSCEWTCHRAWPSAPRPIGLVKETSASWVKRSPSWGPRLHSRGWSRGRFLRLPLSVDRGPFPEVHGGLQGSGDWMASPGEGLMLFRSDPGLGGASWAAMMRPSCCNYSRPSSPCSTTTTAPV